MTTLPTTRELDPIESTWLPMKGGATAPGRARSAVLSWLNSAVSEKQRSDIALIVSELVTNSVVHADVGSDQTLTVELQAREDRLLIAVTDPGSRLEPHVAQPTDCKLGQQGLYLVRELSAAWGFDRDRIGTTRVWCEFPLGLRSATA